MKCKVAFVELPVLAGVVPLASGYMEACSRADPVLNETYAFEKISFPIETPYVELVDALERADADVYAFSSYVWNSRLVRRLRDHVTARKPKVTCVLGGPQVMFQGERYLSPGRENDYICNGEGERTFPNLLRALAGSEHDIADVKGLSFFRDGRLITTPDEPRISDLGEIPSPFLEGVFEQEKYSWMLIETNRGCPFRCNYCFWGAATGAKVHRYDDDRVRRELEWISQSGCWYLFVADANWGILKRDVELSRLIAENHRRGGAPRTVYFCGSKNTPERVAEITRIFHDAGMIVCQSVALQSLNPEALRRAERQNIKASTYTELQQSLNRDSIPSFVEMIWPLPGETLSSYQEGIGELCARGADCFLTYPLLLINNVELAEKREEYGLVTVQDADPRGEAEIVVQTAEVDAEAYAEGCRYAYAVCALYSTWALRGLSHYLHSTGSMSYADLFRGFVKFWMKHPGHPWTDFTESSIKSLDYVTFNNVGAAIHLMMHAERDAFDGLLQAFVRRQSFWRDPEAQFLFECDLVNRPYVYGNTEIGRKRHMFRQIRIADVLPEGYRVEISGERAELVERLTGLNIVAAGESFVARVNHRRRQLPYMAAKPLHEHYAYCQDMLHRMRELVPLWRVESQPEAGDGASAALGDPSSLLSSTTQVA